MFILKIILLIAFILLAAIRCVYDIIDSSSDYDDMFFEKVIITSKKNKNYSMTGRVVRSFVLFGKKYYEIKIITGEYISVRANKVKIYE